MALQVSSRLVGIKLHTVGMGQESKIAWSAGPRERASGSPDLVSTEGRPSSIGTDMYCPRFSGAEFIGTI